MRREGCVGVLFAAVACGGAPNTPPPFAPSPEPEVPSSPRRPFAETAPPSRAAPVAPGIWVRLGAPRRTLDKLPSIAASFPSLQLVSWLDDPAASPYGAAVAAVIDLTQPVDVALDLPTEWFFDPTPTWSFRVRSPEAIAQGSAGLTLRRVSAGVWNIELPAPESPPPLDLSDQAEQEAEEGDEYEGDPGEAVAPPACQLRHLPEPLGFRILCSATAELLDSNAAFLTAAERDASLLPDFHVELGGSLYREMLSKRRVQLEAASAPAPAPGTAPTVAKLFRDAAQALLLHDQLDGEVALRGALAHVELQARFQAALDAPLLRGFFERATSARLPATCAHLPSDSAFVACFSGLGDDIMRAFVDGVVEALGEELQVSTADHAEITAALRGVVPSAGHFSAACGVDPDEAFRALAAPEVISADDAGAPLSAGSIRSLNAALGGWCAIGIDADPARYLAATERAYRSNRLKTPRKTPEVNRRSISRLRQGAVPRRLPSKTQHYVVEIRPDPSYIPATIVSAPPILPYDMHTLVVPDGARVWLITSRSDRLAADRARALLAPASGERSWPELSRFAADGALGFFGIDFAAVAALDIEWDSKLQRARAREALKTAIVTSGKDDKRVPFWLDVAPRTDEPGYAIRMRSEVPLFTVLGDIAAATAGESAF